MKNRRPVKTLLSALGIALALAMVVTGRYAYDAIDRLKEVQFHGADRSDISVSFNEPRSPAIRHELERMPGVAQSELFRAVPVRLRHGVRSHSSAIVGLETGAALRRVVDMEGEAFAAPVHGLMLTTALADMLAAHPGDDIEVHFLEGTRRTVRVPLAATVDEMVGTSAWMQIDALHALAQGPNQVNGAFLRVDPGRRADVRRVLAGQPAVGGVAERRAMLASFERTVEESFVISLTTMLAFAILIAAGIVYNSGRIALSERARELASLRVLGFTRREVARMFLGEQAFLVAAALPFGMIIGFGFCWLIAVRGQTEMFRLPLVVEGTSYLFGVAVVAASAAVTALALRRRVDRLDLVEVLKARE